jgi:hypothetical protein
VAIGLQKYTEKKMIFSTKKQQIQHFDLFTYIFKNVISFFFDMRINKCYLMHHSGV